MSDYYIDRIGMTIVGTENAPSITLLADNSGKSIRMTGAHVLNQAIARIVAEEVTAKDREIERLKAELKANDEFDGAVLRFPNPAKGKR